MICFSFLLANYNIKIFSGIIYRSLKKAGKTGFFNSGIIPDHIKALVTWILIDVRVGVNLINTYRKDSSEESPVNGLITIL
jgi:hypothetical protein